MALWLGCAMLVSAMLAVCDSNFGFNLPWWDWLFRTYRREPESGHDGMTIGIPQLRDPKEQRLDRMLTQPFRNDVSYPP